MYPILVSWHLRCRRLRRNTEQSVPERFEQTVGQFADHLALKDDQAELTYREMNHLANQVAWMILERLGDGNQTVALLFNHDLMSLVALLGAAKAGKVFVPLDLKYPTSQLLYSYKDSRSLLVLTNTKNEDLTKQIAGDHADILNLDKIPSNTATHDPGLPIKPSSPAGIFYTSGSTGKPRGVLISHRTLLYRGAYYHTTDHVTHLISYAFTASFPFDL